MKIKLVCALTLLASTEALAINDSIEVNEKGKVNQTIEQNILETANLMDEINLLKLKLEKEMLNKSLNEERLSNIEIQDNISNFYSKEEPKEESKEEIKKEIAKHNPADGPFNSNGIRLLSVTSLQNMGSMVVFSFYGRKYNRASGEQFKEAHVTIDNDYVIFKHGNRSYKFSY